MARSVMQESSDGPNRYVTTPELVGLRAASNATVTWSATGNVATATVTFPTGRFSIAPVVVCTPNFADFGTAAQSVTATGFTIQAYSATSRAAGFQLQVGWVAVVP